MLIKSFSFCIIRNEYERFATVNTYDDNVHCLDMALTTDYVIARVFIDESDVSDFSDIFDEGKKRNFMTNDRDIFQ